MTAQVTRVGWGFDAHRLDGQPPLRLGGVIVSEGIGVSATSDGDVLAHAVTDALLGGCVLGDIGEHFSSDDPQWADADSMDLLERVMSMAKSAGWEVAHVDATVIAESIRVAPHREAIRRALGRALGTPVDHISVKGTTTDGLGFTGTGEGLAAMAVVTLAPSS